MSTRIGVDVGGTFTDLIAYDDDTGRVMLAKSASTADAREAAVIECVSDGVPGQYVGRCEYFLHGTTVADIDYRRRKARRKRAAESNVIKRANTFHIAGEFEIVNVRVAIDVAVHDDRVGQRIVGINLTAADDVAAEIDDDAIGRVERAVVGSVAQASERANDGLACPAHRDRLRAVGIHSVGLNRKRGGPTEGKKRVCHNG